MLASKDSPQSITGEDHTYRAFPASLFAAAGLRRYFPALLSAEQQPYLGNWRARRKNVTIMVTIIGRLTMRRQLSFLAAAVLSAAGWAQQNANNVPTVPQTARQALMEMFFSKTPGTFVKHLPAATRAALDKSGALASMQQYSAMLNQLQAQGQNVQTFETGSVLVSTDDPKTGAKAEVTVENDALRGDTDDIEVTFHMYKNGQEQPSPFRSMFTFTMKQEAEIWTLNEISFTIHVPLADPGFLKIISEKMKPQIVASGSPTPITARPEVSGQTAGSDAMVVAAMRTIVTAEKTTPAVIRRWGSRVRFPASMGLEAVSRMNIRRC